jgi:hypothetical protein
LLAAGRMATFTLWQQSPLLAAVRCGLGGLGKRVRCIEAYSAVRIRNTPSFPAEIRKVRHETSELTVWLIRWRHV